MKLDPQFFKEFSSGQINNLNESIAPKNSVALGMNLEFDYEIGAAVSRLGTALLRQINSGKTVLGLHYDPVNDKFLVAMNASNDATSVIYDAVSGSSSLAGDTASLKCRFLTYLGSTLRLNGTDAPKAWNGSSWITTGGDFDLANMPTGYKVAIEYLDRVYLLVNATAANADEIVYSGVQTGGAVSWTVGNGSVTLEPEEGAGGLTGAGKVPGYILFFKRRSMKRWNFVTANPESMVGIGTCSHESIISVAGICAFFSDSDPDAIGFYITDGSYPTPISHLKAKNIRKWIDAIPTSYYTNISGWGTETHLYWSIGDVTVDGVAYTNVQVKWSIKTGEWAIRSFPSEARVFARYIASSVPYLMCGNDNGEIIYLDKPGVYDDSITGASNTAIPWEILLQEEKFNYNQIKTISERMILISRNIQVGQAYIVAGNKDGKKEAISAPIKGDIAEVALPESVEGNYFQFGARGMQKGHRLTIKEFEIPNIDVGENYV